MHSSSLAVKRATSGHSDGILRKLEGEIKILKGCNHPHLLPLLGYCLSEEGPCLVSPLMRGGSLGMRLRPAEADPAQLALLGLPPRPEPLIWTQRVRQGTSSVRDLEWHHHYSHCCTGFTPTKRARVPHFLSQLRVMVEAIDALLYLHSRHIWHRDFKPDNILLNEALVAYLADTGFAKDAAPEQSNKSMSRMLYGSDGYMDPSMLNSRDTSGSALTDGFAVGVTLLVVITNRSPVDIFTECEEEREQEFEDIDAETVADPTAGWPVHAARAVKSMVLSRGASLCHRSKFKRLKLIKAHQTLVQLLEDAVKATRESASAAPATPPHPPPLPLQQTDRLADGQTALSRQVRGMRKGGAHEGLQRNVSNGFDAVIRRLAAVYKDAASKDDAPATGFEELINYWHSACGLLDAVRRDLHLLRIWRNASDHHDSERWVRDGPHSAEEASGVLQRIVTAIDTLEEQQRGR